MDTSGAGTILTFFAMVIAGIFGVVAVVASSGHWASWLFLGAYVAVAVFWLRFYGN